MKLTQTLGLKNSTVRVLGDEALIEFASQYPTEVVLAEHKNQVSFYITCDEKNAMQKFKHAAAHISKTDFYTAVLMVDGECAYESETHTFIGALSHLASAVKKHCD